MNAITQRDQFACGAACVSFITQKKYNDVISLLGNSLAKRRGFYCKDLATALLKLGFSYCYKYIKPRLKNKIYKDAVIVFIKRSKGYPYGHYLARHKGTWMDPWINLREDSYIGHARSGFRKRLPGKPIYALFPIEN